MTLTPTAQPAMQTAHTIEFAKRFFEHLRDRGVRICHWKSNHHLDRALEGRTDLDVLVHPEDRPALEAGFAEFGFVRVSSAYEARYPGLEDWIGMDSRGCGQLHMHLHYRLILGPQKVKCYDPPLESWILENLRTLETIPVPEAAIELSLLIVRMHLKLEARHLGPRRNKTALELFPKAIREEFLWLAEEVSAEDLRSSAERSGLRIDPSHQVRFMERFLSGELSRTDVAGMRDEVFAAMEAHRWEGRVAAWWRGRLAKFFKKGRLRRCFRPRKKRLVQGGRVVAILGADGAGKSTLAERLSEHLAWKIQVETAYLGIPKRSLLVSTLRSAHKRCRSLRLKGPARFFRSLSWIWIARTRLRTATRIRERAAKGTIVITDRYPQPEFASMRKPMDGPRIASENGGQRDFFSSWEERIYASIPPPDDTFVLTAPLECLRARESGPSMESHQDKVAAIDALAREPRCFAIDASLSKDEVFSVLVRELWRRVSAGGSHAEAVERAAGS